MAGANVEMIENADTRRSHGHVLLLPHRPAGWSARI
jgi:hypothetical protein